MHTSVAPLGAFPQRRERPGVIEGAEWLKTAVHDRDDGIRIADHRPSYWDKPRVKPYHVACKDEDVLGARRTPG